VQRCGKLTGCGIKTMCMMSTIYITMHRRSGKLPCMPRGAGLSTCLLPLLLLGSVGCCHLDMKGRMSSRSNKSHNLLRYAADASHSCTSVHTSSM
jgi:hypothetical protein